MKASQNDHGAGEDRDEPEVRESRCTPLGLRPIAALHAIDAPPIFVAGRTRLMLA